MQCSKHSCVCQEDYSRRDTGKSQIPVMDALAAWGYMVTGFMRNTSQEDPGGPRGNTTEHRIIDGRAHRDSAASCGSCQECNQQECGQLGVMEAWRHAKHGELGAPGRELIMSRLARRGQQTGTPAEERLGGFLFEVGLRRW